MDIGANIGYFTVLLGYLVGLSGKVIAYEANPLYYVDNSSAQSVSASSNNITSATVAMKYARLKVVATTNTDVVADYKGRA